MVTQLDKLCSCFGWPAAVSAVQISVAVAVGYPSRQDGAILLVRDYPPCPAGRISLKAIIINLYWPSLFGQDSLILASFFFQEFMDATEELGQYPLIIWPAPRAGKVNQNPACDWLPYSTRWNYLARTGLPVAPYKKNFPESRIINPLLTTLVRSGWLDIGLALFMCVHAKRELGQYPAILTSHLVNNPYILTSHQVHNPYILTWSKCAVSWKQKDLQRLREKLANVFNNTRSWDCVLLAFLCTHCVVFPSAVTNTSHKWPHIRHWLPILPTCVIWITTLVNPKFHIHVENPLSRNKN